MQTIYLEAWKIAKITYVRIFWIKSLIELLILNIRRSFKILMHEITKRINNTNMDILSSIAVNFLWKYFENR